MLVIITWRANIVLHDTLHVSPVRQANFYRWMWRLTHDVFLLTFKRFGKRTIILHGEKHKLVKKTRACKCFSMAISMNDKMREYFGNDPNVLIIFIHQSAIYIALLNYIEHGLLYT